MIAGALSPNQFDRTSCTNALRLAATANGCTVAARAASNTLATARACPAAPELGPRPRSENPHTGRPRPPSPPTPDPATPGPANPEVTDENDDAADPNSEANPSQAAAASSIGAEPAPVNISTELISGG